jgi:uncharacterized membrane protein
MKQVLKNWHDEHMDDRSWGDILADGITRFVGSWTFITIHIIWFAGWILLPVEPYPFGLLTMVVSLEAILLSTFIMISQNRASDRDRIQAQADYETNITAKLEIEDLQERLARIETEKLDEILKILKK